MDPRQLHGSLTLQYSDLGHVWHPCLRTNPSSAPGVCNAPENTRSLRSPWRHEPPSNQQLGCRKGTTLLPICHATLVHPRVHSHVMQCSVGTLRDRGRRRFSRLDQPARRAADPDADWLAGIDTPAWYPEATKTFCPPVWTPPQPSTLSAPPPPLAPSMTTKDPPLPLSPEVQAMLRTFTSFLALKDPGLLASLGLHASASQPPHAPQQHPLGPSLANPMQLNLVQAAK